MYISHLGYIVVGIGFFTASRIVSPTLKLQLLLLVLVVGVVLRPPPERAETGFTGFSISCVDDSDFSGWTGWVVVSFGIVTLLLLGILSCGGGLGAGGRLTGRGGCCLTGACGLNGGRGDGCGGLGYCCCGRGAVAGSGWLAIVAYDGGEGFESWTLNGVFELSL
jgi:hypothetical protein